MEDDIFAANFLDGGHENKIISRSEQDGRDAAKCYFNSRHYAGLTKDIIASDAAKLFLPPVIESMSQISTPMPQARVEWIKGFKDMVAELKALCEIMKPKNVD